VVKRNVAGSPKAVTRPFTHLPLYEWEGGKVYQREENSRQPHAVVQKVQRAMWEHNQKRVAIFKIMDMPREVDGGVAPCLGSRPSRGEEEVAGWKG